MVRRKFKKNKEVYLFYKNVEGAHPFFTPDDCINFYIRIYLFDEIRNDAGRWYWNKHKSKTIVDVKFKFDDLTKDENILTKIKTRIKELKNNSCNLTFNTGFIKIIINYLILHPPDVCERMMKAHYKRKEKLYAEWDAEEDIKKSERPSET